MTRRCSCGRTRLTWAASLLILMALAGGCGFLGPDETRNVGFRVQGPPGARAFITYTAPGTWGQANVDLPFFADIGAVTVGERVTLNARSSAWLSADILVDGDRWRTAGGQNIGTGGEIE